MTVAPVRAITNRLDAAIISQAELLDAWAKPVQGWIASAVRFGGTAGQASKNFLNGVWLGHPLHPALTDVPIGAWFVSLVFDMLGFEEIADASLRIGVLAAIPTALAGAADWADASEQPRRVGLVHALLNIGALGLYLGSIRARSMGNRGFGAGLSASGFTLASLAAWLGGELVYGQGTNVNRNAWTPMVPEFMGAADYDSLEDGKLASASIAVDGRELRLLLFKRGDEVLALGATCSHWGGPLPEGKLINDDDCVECPWHASRFDLRDGSVKQGPATAPAPVFETRVRAGRVEVRRIP